MKKQVGLFTLLLGMTLIGSMTLISSRSLAAYEHLTTGRMIPSPFSGRVDQNQTGTSDVRASGDRWLELNQMVQLYNERFKVDEESRAPLRVKYDKYQTGVIEKWKKEGALLSVMKISNDMTSLVVEVFALEDESRRFMGFVYEKSKYIDFEDRALFRVLHSQMLLNPVSFMSVNKQVATTLQILPETADRSKMILQYPLDIKKQIFDKLELELVHGARGWAVYDSLVSKFLQKVHIVTWMSLLPLNGGVKRVLLDSRDACVLSESCP